MAEDARVGSAFVEIRPQLAKNFQQQLRGEVEPAVRGVEQSMRRLGTTARTEVGGGLDTASRSASQLKSSLDGASATASRGFRGASSDLDRAATSGRGLRGALDQASSSGTRLSAGSQALVDKADALARKWEKVPAEIGRSRQEVDRTEQSTRTLSNTASEGIGRITRQAAGLVAAYAGVRFFQGVINDASDLAESTSKAENVFKDATGTVADFARNSAESFGIANKEALEMGATFGNLLTSMGLTREASASMSVELLKLGADFASFNNISIDEALNKIRAGLVGEFEPMRSLGVTLTATAVAAKAVELGLAASTKEVSSAAKIQATYALILEQSKNAQGDFQRTADDLANSQRIMNALWTEARTSMGEVLLPVFLELIQAVKDVLPQIRELGTAFSGVLAKGLDGVIPTVKIFASALTAIAPVLEKIPAPVVAIAANLLIMQKALDKLGIENALTRPLRRLFETLNSRAIDSIDGLGARIRRGAVDELRDAVQASDVSRPIVRAFGNSRKEILTAADAVVEGVGTRITTTLGREMQNRTPQQALAELGDSFRSTRRTINGELEQIRSPETALRQLGEGFRRQQRPLQQASVAALHGVGNAMSRQLQREISQVTPGGTITGLQRLMEQTGNTVAQASLVGVQGVGQQLNRAVTNEVQAATRATQGLAAASTNVSAVISRTPYQQAAAGTRTFGQAVSGVAGVALPALGIALGVGTAALGVWQQKRAEAAAQQKEWTAAMLADAQAITAAGGTISDAVKGIIGEQTKAAVTQELQDKKRFDDLQRITDATGGQTSALKVYLEALQATAEGQGENNEKVREFRRLLLQAGEVRIQGIFPNATEQEIRRAEQAFIDTGEAIEGFNVKGNDSPSIMGRIGSSSRAGLLDQFNRDVENTEESVGQVNAQLREMEKAGEKPAKAASTMTLLKDSVDETGKAMDDAKQKADDFAAALDRLGGPALDAVRAEEDRQLAINRALDNVLNQDVPTQDDVDAAQNKLTDATNKRVRAERELAEALASGTQEEQERALAAKNSAGSAEAAADQALFDIRKRFEEGGLNVQEVLFGNTDEAISARRGFRDVVQTTFDQAKIIQQEQGAEAAARFWDETIAATRDRSGEWAGVLDAEIQRRGITDGRSIFFQAAMDPEAPLTPDVAQLLDTAALQKKVIDVAVNAEGDVPDDIAPIITNRLNTAQVVNVITQISSQLGPNQAVDPALLFSLSEDARKNLALDLAVTEGASILPVEVLEPLLRDKQFAKDLLLNLRATGQQVDETTPLGKALKAATEGTPVEVLLDPKVTSAPFGTGEAEVLAELEQRTAEVAKTKLEGDIASPEFRGSLSSIGAKFEELEGKTEAARRKTVEFEAANISPKTAEFLVEGGERLDEARRKYTAIGDMPDIEKTIRFRVVSTGEAGFDAVLRAVREGRIPIPPTATGGIFNDPQVRLIGEAGPEAVIPMAAGQHERAAQLLAEGGFFERFAAEFASHLGAVVRPAPSSAPTGGGVVNHFYTNDAEVVARKVGAIQARALAAANG